MNARAAATLLVVFGSLAQPALAAERVRAGQWETTVEVAGHTVSKSMCLSQSDADAINGDKQSIAAYVEKVSAAAGCKVNDVQIDGNQVRVTTRCAAGRQNVGTTTYHGDSSETENTNGAKSTSKRIGDCQ